MTEVKIKRIIDKIKKQENTKDYVMENFQEFGFPNKREAIRFCTEQLK